MASVFYVIKVELDDSGEIIDGTDEAVMLLKHPVAIHQALEELHTRNSDGCPMLNVFKKYIS